MEDIYSKIEHAELSIADFIETYDGIGDPIWQIAKTAVAVYVKKYIGEMSVNEIVQNLSQHGDLFEYHVQRIFQMDA